MQKAYSCSFYHTPCRLRSMRVGGSACKYWRKHTCGHCIIRKTNITYHNNKLMKTDIEIAHSTELKRIDEVAKQLGIDPEAIEHYGKHIAKLPLSLIDEKKKASSSW